MSGIVAIFNIKSDLERYRQQALEMSKKLRHRGPDWSGIFCENNTILAHERLAIVDPASGKQPLFSKDRRLVLAVNGEIYNHQEIGDRLKDKYEFLTNSDFEVILALYREKGKDFLEDLNGIFAFALYDLDKNEFLIGRDHIGIIPLYQGWDDFGTYYVASALKSLEGYCKKIEVFLPGHYYHSLDSEPQKWYTRDWIDFEAVKDNHNDINLIRKSLEAAVHRQLMSDRPRPRR